eukprot:4440150-Prymnesium_polylepis.1
MATLKPLLPLLGGKRVLAIGCSIEQHMVEYICAAVRSHPRTHFVRVARGADDVDHTGFDRKKAEQKRLVQIVECAHPALNFTVATVFQRGLLFPTSEPRWLRERFRALQALLKEQFGWAQGPDVLMLGGLEWDMKASNIVSREHRPDWDTSGG